MHSSHSHSSADNKETGNKTTIRYDTESNQEANSRTVYVAPVEQPSNGEGLQPEVELLSEIVNQRSQSSDGKKGNSALETPADSESLQPELNLLSTIIDDHENAHSSQQNERVHASDDEKEHSPQTNLKEPKQLVSELTVLSTIADSSNTNSSHDENITSFPVKMYSPHTNQGSSSDLIKGLYVPVVGRPTEKLSTITDFEQDENKQRGNWSGQLDFILSCLGFAVGLGNIWRFPYLCYKNGGGAFLIPYTLMLIVVGMPLYFMEMALGQFSSKGPIAIWCLSPLFEGVGYAMVIISGLVCIYYNVIMAWILFYLYDSFRATVPYAGCDNAWNTNRCFSKENSDRCMSENSTNVFYQRECYNALDAYLLNIVPNDTIKVLPAEEYFTNYVLGMSSGIGELGDIRWKLLLALIVAWTFIALCMVKGIKSSGKVVYFTSTFPFVILFIMLGRGLTLDGYMEGIKFYVIPDFDKLKNPTVWVDAAGQTFFSLGVAFGTIISLSSYNKFQNNFIRDALIVATIDWLTSIFGGFCVFSILGFLSHEIGVPVESVITSGPGLAFAAYPEAISRMSVPTLWSILFFLMLLTLGVDSQFVYVETILTAVIDKYPSCRRRKPIVVAILCTFLFVLGLTMITDGGLYMFTIFNDYGANWSAILIALCECLVIAFVYGMGRFYEDIRMMLETDSVCLRWYWRICWGFVTPALIAAVLLFYWGTYATRYLTTDDGIYVFPTWAEALGWLMALFSVVMIPAVALWKFCTLHQELPWRVRLKTLCRPTADWRPAVSQFRIGPYDFEADIHEVAFVHLDVPDNKEL